MYISVYLTQRLSVEIHLAIRPPLPPDAHGQTQSLKDWLNKFFLF